MRYLFGAAAALILSGCVSVQTVVPAATTPHATAGYVAGVFSTAGATEFGLGITSIHGGEETVLPFADAATGKFRIPDVPDRVTMIQLPGGEYRISSWLTFSSLTREKITRKALPAGAESLQFTVTPGRVRYLGKFAAVMSYAGLKINYRIDPQRIAQDELALLLEMGYPNFSLKLVDPQPGLIY
jgi:hypothetical protein